MADDGFFVLSMLHQCKYLEREAIVLAGHAKTISDVDKICLCLYLYDVRIRAMGKEMGQKIEK